MRGPEADAESPSPEIVAMTVWPSIAAYRLGRQIGQLCSISAGVGKFFTIGKLMALVTIPVSLLLFFWRLAPGVARRYVLTDRRVMVQKGLGAVEAESIGLADFDAIALEVLAGQQFLRAGDLVFQAGGKQVLRLSGVQHPEGFRQACLRARQASVAVSRVVAEQRERTAATGGSRNQPA